MSSDSPDRPLPSWANPEGPSESVTEALKALQTYKKKDGEKVIVRFKAVGNAPIMKQNFFKITSSNRFQAVIQFLRKELAWKAGEPLHTYINLAFSPAPDDTVSNLFKSFATDGHLIVNYSTTAAWG
ncbi:APG12-domain-containing protein [Armillaria gallica]|uniref:Ubiquitin-like protein ATG12 n=3 Tax=Armillaria TaxID=47424 RepID=A0A2H3BNI9_9AGAR|nr:APG12-domain-containing protein [Armillaria borealis]PBK71230.1 APG12-domain-containing protein [Armillaria solidipes]PBK83972.1 APG12-domain-containing protein [Armillaria gallica]